MTVTGTAILCPQTREDGEGCSLGLSLHPTSPPFLRFSPLLLRCPLFSAPLFLTPPLFPGLLASGELPSTSPEVCPAGQV